MKLINRPRQGGKTTALIKLMAARSDLMLVAPTRRQADAAWEQSARMGYSLATDRFLSAHQAALQRNGVPSKELVIDELEGFLQSLGFLQKVVAVAGTFEQEPVQPQDNEEDAWENYQEVALITYPSKALSKREFLAGYRAAQAAGSLTAADLQSENDLLLAQASTLHQGWLERVVSAEAERDALQAQVDAVRKYADERAWYGQRNRTVDSSRIASDLQRIVGPLTVVPEGEE